MDNLHLLNSQKTADRCGSGIVLLLASPCIVLPYFVPPGFCKHSTQLALLERSLQASIRLEVLTQPLCQQQLLLSCI